MQPCYFLLSLGSTVTGAVIHSCTCRQQRKQQSMPKRIEAFKFGDTYVQSCTDLERVPRATVCETVGLHMGRRAFSQSTPLCSSPWYGKICFLFLASTYLRTLAKFSCVNRRRITNLIVVQFLTINEIRYVMEDVHLFNSRIKVNSLLNSRTSV